MLLKWEDDTEYFESSHIDVSKGELVDNIEFFKSFGIVVSEDELGDNI